MVSQGWQPISPYELFALLKGITIPWWIAGGWALDFFIGHQTRMHDDIDILVLRSDQQVLHQYLKNWDLQACNPPGSLRIWKENEYLNADVNNVWCRKKSTSPWCFQIMLMDSEGEYWVFRRHERVKGLIADIGKITSDGIPYLRPEIQLLFKATGSLREKDIFDFKQVITHLDKSAISWLKYNLSLVSPGHQWLDFMVKK
jgi:Aminoglycoside-2''-adenylyltransferase